MNKRPYHIKDESCYNNLVIRANELTKLYKEYWTVIWSKEHNSWWMTYMPNNESKLVGKM